MMTNKTNTKFVAVFFGHSKKLNHFHDASNRRSTWLNFFLPKWYHNRYVHGLNKRFRFLDFFICIYLLFLLRGRYQNIVFHRPVYAYRWFFYLLKILNPRVKLIFWTMDDILRSHNYRDNLLPLLKSFDRIYNCKITNVHYLQSENIPFIYYIQPYCSYTHLRSSYGPSHDYDVSFVGFYEKKRYESLVHLAENGISVVIYGRDWPRTKVKNLVVYDYEVHREDYVNALKSAKISICFLRKINDDTHTCRSLELPAMYQFFLAEHSNEHETLYNCDEILFSDNDDLLRLVIKYLNDLELRKSLVGQLHKQILNSANSFDEHLTNIELEFHKI